MAIPLFLGIDTGGTYTDAVLWSEATGLVAKAKALTTRHDLAVGIGGAADAVLAASGVAPSSIKLVSMSTTLATNALVEGQGGRAALVMIGFSETELSRDGLKNALGGDPVIYCQGGHDVHGNAAELDLSPLEQALPELSASVTAFAVCGHFATRNPAHELAAIDMIRSRTRLPATASHQLTSKLGGPRRALTTLLNARLVGMIERLIEATEGFMAVRGIAAPLMVVRGDGALVSAGFAKARPIETILSGPAASLVGARHLTNIENAIVCDIGGTTTDIAVLDAGRPRIDPEGATVGGFRTMVEAVAMRTFGLGGDSEVTLEEGALDPRIHLGPRRLMPLSLAATLYGETVTEPLQRQLLAANAGRMDAKLAVRTGAPDRAAAGLAPGDARLLLSIGDKPMPLDRLLSSSSQVATLNRLVARGLVHIIGFTPSDAAHVVGRQANWNAEAAVLGAELFARRRDGRGRPVAADPQAFCVRVLEEVTNASARAVFETAFSEDGLDGAVAVRHTLVERAMSGQTGIARLALTLDRPLVGLGASAGLHYAALPRLVGGECLVPADADVANALGAVAGQVRISVRVRVSQPGEGIFRVDGQSGLKDYLELDDALAEAEACVAAAAVAQAQEAGAFETTIEIVRDINATTVEGRPMFIEANIVATASGRPRIAL